MSTEDLSSRPKYEDEVENETRNFVNDQDENVSGLNQEEKEAILSDCTPVPDINEDPSTKISKGLGGAIPKKKQQVIRDFFTFHIRRSL